MMMVGVLGKYANPSLVTSQRKVSSRQAKKVPGDFIKVATLHNF